MADRRITSIRVPARYEVDGSGPRVSVAHFCLGTGPCGRDVKELFCDQDDQVLVVGQRHADGSSVTFTYPIHTLTGRVEITLA